MKPGDLVKVRSTWMSNSTCDINGIKNTACRIDVKNGEIGLVIKSLDVIPQSSGLGIQYVVMFKTVFVKCSACYLDALEQNNT